MTLRIFFSLYCAFGLLQKLETFDMLHIWSVSIAEVHVRQCLMQEWLAFSGADLG